MTESPKSQATRPLSPHLQVYRLPMTAVMSISHRITGAILCGGCLFITAFLVAAAMGEGAYNTAVGLASHPIGTVFLFLWSFVLLYHTCNGIRHLIWDTGHLFEKRANEISGWVVLFATVVLHALIWFCVGERL